MCCGENKIWGRKRDGIIFVRRKLWMWDWKRRVEKVLSTFFAKMGTMLCIIFSRINNRNFPWLNRILSIKHDWNGEYYETRKRIKCFDEIFFVFDQKISIYRVNLRPLLYKMYRYCRIWEFTTVVINNNKGEGK